MMQMEPARLTEALRPMPVLVDAWSGAVVAFFLPVAFGFVLVAPQGLSWFPTLMSVCILAAMRALGDRVDWPTLTPCFRSLMVPAAVFVGWASLRSIWTQSPGDSLPVASSFKASAGLVAVAAALMLSLRPRGAWYWLFFPIVLMVASLVLGAILAALVFWDWRLTSEHRLTQVWHYNRAALFLVLLWPISMFAIGKMDCPPRVQSLFRFVTSATVGIVILISWNESAKLAFVVTVACHVLFGRRPHLAKKLLWISGAAAVLLAFTLIKLGILGAQAWQPSLLEGEPMAGRLHIWSGLVDVVRSSPWIGHGVEYVRTNGYYSPGLDRVEYPHHPHSALIQVWVDLGMVGAVALAFLVGAYVRLVPVADRNLAALYLSIIAGALTIWSVSHGMWQSWYVGLVGVVITFAVWVHRRAIYEGRISTMPSDASQAMVFDMREGG